MAKGCLIFVCLGLAGMFIFCGTGAYLLKQKQDEYVATTTPEQRAADKEKRDKEAREYSAIRSQERLVKELVTDVLKAPSTAKFSLDSGYEKGAPENIIIRGYVDSQNGFGAMIRTKIEAVSIGREKPQLKFLRLGDKILIDKLTAQP